MTPDLSMLMGIYPPTIVICLQTPSKRKYAYFGGVFERERDLYFKLRCHFRLVLQISAFFFMAMFFILQCRKVVQGIISARVSGRTQRHLSGRLTILHDRYRRAKQIPFSQHNPPGHSFNIVPFATRQNGDSSSDMQALIGQSFGALRYKTA